MSSAIQWLDEAKTRLEEMDYLGITPDPQPVYSDDELLEIIQLFWAEGHSIGSTYAWFIASEQNVNPFEIKKVFDDMERKLQEMNARTGEVT